MSLPTQKQGVANDKPTVPPKPTKASKPTAWDVKKYIHESNLIEGVDDWNEDKQSMEAWDFISKKTYISEKALLELHSLIMVYQMPFERGKYRTVPVYVGGKEMPFQIVVPDLVREWLGNFMDWTPKEAHIKFEKIHPFLDGNGRTGRMLMWWHEIKLGKTPTLILNSEKQNYYKWFNAGEGGSQPKLTKEQGASKRATPRKEIDL